MSRKPKAAEPSQRQLRVAEMIRHKIADMLTRGEVHDEVIAGHVITVPEVRLSPDLRLATIYVMPLGGVDASSVVEALDTNKRYIRGEVARAINLKFAPDIRFRLDETFDEAARIGRLLDSPKVRQDVEKD
jgi:ribosome-binding factor A